MPFQFGPGSLIFRKKVNMMTYKASKLGRDFSHKILTYKGQIVFEKITAASFQRVPKLFIENEACFIYVQHGEFSLRMPGDFITLSQGQGFLAKCFDYFFETSLRQRQENDCFDMIGVLLFPEILKDIFQIEISVPKHKSNYNLKKIEIDSLLENFKDSINILLENPELADDLLIKTKLKEFVLLISRTEQGLSLQEFISGLFQRNPTEFRKTVLHNIYAQLSLGELAHLCGTSLSTFKRKFKETFNESPTKYITTKRLEKAASLLRLEGSRISEVAYDCGFNSISSFNRTFKKQYGKTPSEFKLDQIDQSLS